MLIRTVVNNPFNPVKRTYMVFCFVTVVVCISAVSKFAIVSQTSTYSNVFTFIFVTVTSLVTPLRYVQEPVI